MKYLVSFIISLISVTIYAETTLIDVSSTTITYTLEAKSMEILPKHFFHNNDGSVTLVEPEILIGDIYYPILMDNSNLTGTCTILERTFRSILGHSQAKEATAEEKRMGGIDVVQIGEKGNYITTKKAEYSIESVTCY